MGSSWKEFSSNEDLFLLRSLLDVPPTVLPFLSVINHIIDSTFPPSSFRIFAAPSPTPSSFIVIEKNPRKCHFIYAASLTKELDEEKEFEGILRLLLVEEKADLVENGFVLDTYPEIHSMFVPLADELLPELKCQSNQTFLFFMDDEQVQRILEEEKEPPVGFTLEEVNVERDWEVIHSSWVHATNPADTRERLSLLPSSCLRENSTGKVVSWVLSSPFGQLAHLFTLPTHRRQGFASLVERALAHKLIRLGRRPFKYMDVGNENARAQALKEGIWSLWTVNGQPGMHYFAEFSSRSPKSAKKPIT